MRVSFTIIAAFAAALVSAAPLVSNGGRLARRGEVEEYKAKFAALDAASVQGAADSINDILKKHNSAAQAKGDNGAVVHYTEGDNKSMFDAYVDNFTKIWKDTPLSSISKHFGAAKERRSLTRRAGVTRQSIKDIFEKEIDQASRDKLDQASLASEGNRDKDGNPQKFVQWLDGLAEPTDADYWSNMKEKMFKAPAQKRSLRRRQGAIPHVEPETSESVLNELWQPKADPNDAKAKETREKLNVFAKKVLDIYNGEGKKKDGFKEIAVPADSTAFETLHKNWASGMAPSTDPTPWKSFWTMFESGTVPTIPKDEKAAE